jgi:glycosyltransferase involved in cell wall biosynthesis
VKLAHLPSLPPITLIGHPFGSTGRAQHIRAVWRALRTAGIAASIVDIVPTPAMDDPGLVAEFGPHLTETLSGGIRVFHLNGAEIGSRVLPLLHAAHGAFPASYNIVFPAWELPRYPAEWGHRLDRFDEVWTATRFADDAIRPAVNVPVWHIPNACEPHVATPLRRAHFAIPERRFAVLFYFDFWSYAPRKNPAAVVETFARTLAARPGAELQLVLKLGHSSHDVVTAEELRADIARFGDRVTLIDATLSDNEAKNLVRCCDCFLSLHRSEGFGRGPAEAMFFGKPVIATGWSGNMEYMQPDNSFPVRYTLVPVGLGEYPFGDGQVWAEPDVAHAAELLIGLIDDPPHAQAIGARARAHMLANFSDLVLGARYRARFEAIAAGK